MDPILALPPDLPVHDHAEHVPVAVDVVAQWPLGTFIENLCVLDDGAIAVSILSEARIDRIEPDGSVAPLRQFAAPPTGLVLSDGALFAAVGEPGAHVPDLWRIDPETGAGDVWMPLTGMIFANGIAPLGEGVILVADSWQGRIWRVDLRRRQIAPWAEDERLTRAPGFDFLPGANGIKAWGNEVTVSSTGRALLLRIAINPDGSAGAAALLAERTRVDDLAYDAAGNLYLTTHIGHSLDRLDRAGRRVTLADGAQGLAGSTACAFGRDGALFVTTTGGIVGPRGGVLEPARLVRLAVQHDGGAGA